jgi:hypothetical protein
MEYPGTPPLINPSLPPVIKKENRPSATLVVATGCLVFVNGLRGFAEGMIRSRRISHALGSATFCLLFPIVVALLFSIGKRFRNARSRTKVVLWTTVLMLVAGVGNLAQHAAGPKLLRSEVATEGTGQHHAAASTADGSATPKADAAQLAQIFPALYWYASDACLRETTRHGFGHPQKYDEYVKSNKAIIEKLEEVPNQGRRLYTVRLRIGDSENPNEYWILELTGEGKRWEPKTGYKYMGGKEAFDLFKDESFAGIKVMGSMKPYFQKMLTAYSEGKDLSAVFKKNTEGSSR